MPSYGSGIDTLYGGSGITQPRDTYGQFAGGQGVGWSGLEAISLSMGAWAGGIIDHVRANAESLAAEIEEYMKTYAPWEDRTGDARDALQAVVVQDQRSVSIYLGHGAAIFYGYFLETRTYGGVSYAIIQPTIDEYAPTILARAVE